MFRFIALAWDPLQEDQRHTVDALIYAVKGRSSQWEEVCAVPGLVVLCAHLRTAGMGALTLSQQHGVVLGSVFTRTANSNGELRSLQRFTAEESEQIALSKGQRLITDFWGNYVAFILSGEPGHTHILKDPSGSLPCFWTSYRHVAVFFSCLSDCLALGIQFSVNQDFLKEYVVGGSRDPELNSLNEVSQVFRGQCIEFRHSATLRKHSYWEPRAFSESRDVSEDLNDAAAALRETVTSCTQTLAAQHTTLIHRLSGGLDSSIVLGCMGAKQNRRPRVICYTYFVPGGRSDERRWARLAAEHAGCEHIEVPFEPADDRLEEVGSLQPSVEPEPLISYLKRPALERELANRFGGTAVFNGQGGDSGLGSDSAPFAVLEFLQKHGLGARITPLSLHVALRTELTFWTVLTRSMYRWLFGSNMSHQRHMQDKATSVVVPDLRAGLLKEETYPHPWFRSIRDIPWSTIRRLGVLLHTPECYDLTVSPDMFAPVSVAPLYAQPVIELCLRLPAYVLFADGRDRGLARRAFSAEVPAAILRRQWKDRAPEAASRIVRDNREFLRSRLLDGVLVKRGLLDRRALEDALSPTPKRTITYPGEILRHADAELWAQRWSFVAPPSCYVT